MEHNLEVGTILVAHTECKMHDGINGQALIIGKEYPIKGFFSNMIIIKTENSDNHYFTMKEEDPAYYGNFFDVTEGKVNIQEEKESELRKAAEKYSKELIQSRAIKDYQQSWMESVFLYVAKSYAAKKYHSNH